MLLVWNVSTGCSVYHLSNTLDCIAHMSIIGLETRLKCAIIQVSWAFHGDYIISGSPTGQLVILDTLSGELVQKVDCRSLGYQFLAALGSECDVLVQCVTVWSRHFFCDKKSDSPQSGNPTLTGQYIAGSVKCGNQNRTFVWHLQVRSQFHSVNSSDRQAAPPSSNHSMCLKNQVVLRWLHHCKYCAPTYPSIGLLAVWKNPLYSIKRPNTHQPPA